MYNISNILPVFFLLRSALLLGIQKTIVFNIMIIVLDHHFSSSLFLAYMVLVQLFTFFSQLNIGLVEVIRTALRLMEILKVS